MDAASSTEVKQTRSRRKRQNPRRDNSARGSEVGPSSAADDYLPKPWTSSTPKADASTAPIADVSGFVGDDDFIAFATASDDDHDEPPPPRGWESDKDLLASRSRGSDRDRRYAGRKRKYDDSELDANDGYRSKKQLVDSASRRAPWIESVDWDSCKNVAEMLNKEVEAFLEYISPTPIEHEVRSMTIQLISSCIMSTYPDSQILPFGSFETKLYLPSGDIDLVIQSASMQYTDKATNLRSLANIVRRSGITEKVTIISKAKVPIIKFVTVHGRLSVDISINQINGVAAGQMINRFLKEMPALRALVLVIKSFLNQRSMNEVFSGGLGSYSIVCLAVSFLQMHPKLRRGEIDPARNLGVLVMEFFELYGRYFNYEETGISLRHGGTYFSKARRGWLDSRRPFSLSIEDPGDISNDISKGSFGIYNVRQTLAGAYEMMTASAYLRAGIISARQGGQAVNLRSDSQRLEPLHPDEMSILSSVMGVTQETLNHRRLLQEVYDSQTLKRLLDISVHVAPSSSSSWTNGVAGPSRVIEAESVRSAWGEEDMTLNSDADNEHGRHERSEGGESHISPDHDDESRYGIDHHGPARKRQRTGNQRKDMHTSFTTDDEDAEDSEDSLAREELIYALADNKDFPTQRASLSSDARRAYWASKGLGRGIDNDSS